jgi:hypothetical protein
MTFCRQSVHHHHTHKHNYVLPTVVTFSGQAPTTTTSYNTITYVLPTMVTGWSTPHHMTTAITVRPHLTTYHTSTITFCRQGLLVVNPTTQTQLLCLCRQLPPLNNNYVVPTMVTWWPPPKKAIFAVHLHVWPIHPSMCPNSVLLGRSKPPGVAESLLQVRLIVSQKNPFLKSQR